jgi:hypothetical protein
VYVGKPFLLTTDPQEIKEKKITLQDAWIITCPMNKEQLEQELKRLNNDKAAQPDQIQRIQKEIDKIIKLEALIKANREENDKITKRIYYVEKKKKHVTADDLRKLDDLKQKKEKLDREHDTYKVELGDSAHQKRNMDRIVEDNLDKYIPNWTEIFQQIENVRSTLPADTNAKAAETVSCDDSQELESSDTSSDSEDGKPSEDAKPWTLVVRRNILQQSLWLTKEQREWFQKCEITDGGKVYPNKNMVLQGWDPVNGDVYVLEDKICQGMSQDSKSKRPLTPTASDKEAKKVKSVPNPPTQSNKSKNSKTKATTITPTGKAPNKRPLISQGQGKRQRNKKTKTVAKADTTHLDDDSDDPESKQKLTRIIKGVHGVEVIVPFRVSQQLRLCIMIKFDLHDACVRMFYNKVYNPVLRRMSKQDLKGYFWYISLVSFSSFSRIFAEKRTKGTPWEYLNQVPNCFVQQGVDEFVNALFSSRALHKSNQGFRIHPKARDGNSDTLTFTSAKWNGGLPYSTFFDHSFELKKWQTPQVSSIFSLTIFIRRLRTIPN